MFKKDYLFKILFALELALLPLIIFAQIYIKTEWAVAIFFAFLLLVKIWLELFKNKVNRTHEIIDNIGSIAMFTTLIVYFVSTGYLPKAISIISVVAIVLYCIFRMLCFNLNFGEIIEAVDFCFVIFECLLIVGLAALFASDMLARIGLIAIAICAVVSIGYKLYYIIRYKKFHQIFNFKR